ncbi:hypothetical protein BDV35DRAFT_364320 [Aspergillus flavus]|uniref:Uncharacterized protein n=1 Tax=Aspergillus flavus TaxID=5059 RepID=A0A5N6GRB5_ASPFL|nr:hypothetical protein BDV35DRAFT_364320 [Aspergillus flavus]
MFFKASPKTCHASRLLYNGYGKPFSLEAYFYNLISKLSTADCWLSLCLSLREGLGEP